MRRELLMLGALTTLGVPGAPGRAPPPPADAAIPVFPSDSAVLAIIKQRVADKRSAGIVVGLLGTDGRPRVVAFGDPGPGQPPLDGNSVFEIGSISKVFTATVLAEMVQAGQVKLDDPAQQYLPPSVHMPTRGGKPITLGNLSEQNSGLPRLPTNMKSKDASNPYADYTVAQLYEFLSTYELTRDPGQLFEYSNVGVGLLGHLLALRDGKSYEQMEQYRVWGPLGMTHTAITFTPWMRAHLALGHGPLGRVVSNWDIPTLAGAGAIRSTTLDLLTFVAANLHPERGPLERAMAFAHEDRAAALVPTRRIGLNWIIERAGADTIVWHNGATGGYRTFIGLEPSKGVGVVIMTNSAGEGVDDLGMHLLNPALPLAPKPLTPDQRTAIELPATVLATYVGVYQLRPGFTLDVTMTAGVLSVQATGQAVRRLWPEAETEFFMKEADVQVSFVRNRRGVVTGLVLHQNGNDSSAPKVR